MYANMIIPFVTLESTLIAVTAMATLGSFSGAATPLGSCKRGFGRMIGKYNCIYKGRVRGITA